MLVCLFLFLSCNVLGFPLELLAIADAEWKFDDPTQKAYELVLNLQLEEVHQLIPEPETAHQHYVIASSGSVGIAYHRRWRKVHRIRRSIYQPFGTQNQNLTFPMTCFYKQKSGCTGLLFT